MNEQSSRLPYGEGREALMAATIDVVAEKGLRGVTYRAIAGRARVNHTLVTHHFGSIEGLLAATMEWAIEQSIRESGLERITDFNEAFADSLIESVTREPELQLFQFEMLLESRRSPELRSQVEKLYSSYMSTVEQALKKQGLDTAHQAAIAIFAALDGLMLQFLTINEPAKIRAALVHIGQMVAAIPPLSQSGRVEH